MSDLRPGSTPTPSILVICTANQCRSPLAALQIRQALAGTPWSGVPIVSAGTSANAHDLMCVVSKSMLDNMTHGDDHRSQPVTEAMVRDAAFVITMDRDQRGVIAQLALGTQPKLYTLLEAAGIVHAIAQRDDVRLPTPLALAEHMWALRGSVHPPIGATVPRRRSRRVQRDDGTSIFDGHLRGGNAHLDTVRMVRAVSEEFGSDLARIAARSVRIT